VAGYEGCGFTRRAVEAARAARDKGFFEVVHETSLFAERQEYKDWLASDARQALFNGNSQALSHSTAPLVWTESGYIGGCTEFFSWMERKEAGTEKVEEKKKILGSSLNGTFGLAAAFDGSKDRGDEFYLQTLQPTQFMVLRRAATDDRGVTEALGGFDDTFEKDVTYLCGACKSPLYTSQMKFDCGCGWPGFFTCIDSAVVARTDVDGVRHEILCNGCSSHLGHVFVNEGFNGMECSESGNTVSSDHRHCVNSSSLIKMTMRQDEGTDTKPMQVLTPCTYTGKVFLSASRTRDNPDARTGRSTMSGEWLAGRDSIPQ
jgi:peptide-methionine (R)-S-oxide reductase